MKRYKTWTPTQTTFLPPSPNDWLSKDHFVYFLLDVLLELDVDEIDAAYRKKDPRGTRPYPPRFMAGLLLLGYSQGVYSSRKIESACHENVAFRVFAGGLAPDHTRIAEFRRLHLKTLQKLFVQVLRLCQQAGLVKLGHIALDGTKIQGNASKHKAMSYERMLKKEKALEEEIQELLTRAEATDTDDDKRYGVGVRGDELPQELARRESRLQKIREAKAALEKEARETRAKALRKQADGHRETARTHENPTVAKRAKTRAERTESKARTLDDDDDQAPPTSPTDLPQHETPCTTDATPTDTAQRNFTDPDSRIMPSDGTFLQGYNAQAAVDEDHQIIVAAGLSNQVADNDYLEPMVRRVQASLGSYPEYLTADAGYWSPESVPRLQADGANLFISLAREGKAKPEEIPLGEARRAMSEILESVVGKDIYRRRKATVEPVFGQIKEARGFRRFSLRSLEQADGEWSLVCLTHNLLKLYRSGKWGKGWPASPLLGVLWSRIRTTWAMVLPLCRPVHLHSLQMARKTDGAALSATRT